MESYTSFPDPESKNLAPFSLTVSLSLKIKFIFLKTYFDIEDANDFPSYQEANKTFCVPRLNHLAMFKPERGFCLPTSFDAQDEKDFLIGISKRDILKKFFGLNNSTFKRWQSRLWFEITLIPRALLNTVKLATEILPGLFVALSKSIEETLREKIFGAAPAKGPVAKLLQLITLPARLIYFAGKATTSPMKNARHAWGIFADWRSADNNGLKAVGWILGGLAFLYSVANTAVVYAFVSPYLLLGLSKLSIGSIPYVGKWLAESASAAYQFALNVVSPLSAGLNSIINSIAPYIGSIASNILTFIASQPLALIAGAIPAVIGTPLRRLRQNFTRWCCGAIEYEVDLTKQSQVAVNRDTSREKSCMSFRSTVASLFGKCFGGRPSLPSIGEDPKLPISPPEVPVIPATQTSADLKRLSSLIGNSFARTTSVQP